MLKIKDMNSSNVIRQGDSQPREYQLDTGNLNLNLTNKSATIRLMTADFQGIAYETTATVSSENKISFSIDDIIPAREYRLEITVDDYVFPSRATDGRFDIDPSSHGQEVNIIQVIGKDEIVREVKEQIEPFLGDIEQAELDRQAQEEARETAEGERQEEYQKYGQQFTDVITELSEEKDYHSLPEIAGARGGFDTLGDRLNETTAQLAQTEIELDHKKRNKSDLIGLNDADEELLNFIHDGTGGPVTIESVPKDESVSYGKTNFIHPSINLFSGRYRAAYITGDGRYIENELYSEDRVGEPVELKPNTTYTISKTPTTAFRVILSDIPIKHGVGGEVVFNGASASKFTFTTGATQKYVAIYTGGRSLTPDYMQIEEGTIATKWMAPQQIEGVAPLELNHDSVKIEHVDFIETSKNLFKGDFTSGYLLPSGVFSQNEGVADDRCSILELKPNTTYTISKTPTTAFRVGLSNVPIGHGILTDIVFDNPAETKCTFTTNETQKYVVIYFGGRKTVPEFMQVEEGTIATEWFTYGIKLKNEAVPYFLKKDTENPSYYGIKGDGITDDTKALKDYAEHLRESGGGVLELPPNSNILFTETISIPSNVLVRGNMSTLTLGDDYVLEYRLFRGNPRICPYITTDTNSSDIHFENLTIKGNKNDFRDQLHSGLSFIDTERVSATNVNVYEINYNIALAETYRTMAYNISTVRAKDAYIYGGTFDKGGYECVGVEHSQGVTIDNIRSGRGWRTSLQIHRGSQNIKVLNSTISQVTDTEDAGALTLHGQEDLGVGLKNIQLIGNTINGNFSSNPKHEYNALIQIMDGGIAEDILVKDNILKGNRTGIYGTPIKNFSVLGNNLKIEKGNGIHIYGGSSNVLIDQNIVEVMDGIALSGSHDLATLGTNIGF